jgi:hypothetical protein
MEKEKIGSLVMAIAGIIMITVSAVSYLFYEGDVPTAIPVIGIVFLSMGLGKYRKTNKT